MRLLLASHSNFTSKFPLIINHPPLGSFHGSTYHLYLISVSLLGAAVPAEGYNFSSAARPCRIKWMSTPTYRAFKFAQLPSRQYQTGSDVIGAAQGFASLV